MLCTSIKEICSKELIEGDNHTNYDITKSILDNLFFQESLSNYPKNNKKELLNILERAVNKNSSITNSERQYILSIIQNPLVQQDFQYIIKKYYNSIFGDTGKDRSKKRIFRDKNNKISLEPLISYLKNIETNEEQKPAGHNIDTFRNWFTKEIWGLSDQEKNTIIEKTKEGEEKGHFTYDPETRMIYIDIPGYKKGTGPGEGIPVNPPENYSYEEWERMKNQWITEGYIFENPRDTYDGRKQHQFIHKGIYDTKEFGSGNPALTRMLKRKEHIGKKIQSRTDVEKLITACENYYGFEKQEHTIAAIMYLTAKSRHIGVLEGGMRFDGFVRVHRFHEHMNDNITFFMFIKDSKTIDKKNIGPDESAISQKHFISNISSKPDFNVPYTNERIKNVYNIFNKLQNSWGSNMIEINKLLSLSGTAYSKNKEQIEADFLKYTKYHLENTFKYGVYSSENKKQSMIQDMRFTQRKLQNIQEEILSLKDTNKKKLKMEELLRKKQEIENEYNYYMREQKNYTISEDTITTLRLGFSHLINLRQYNLITKKTYNAIIDYLEDLYIKTPLINKCIPGHSHNDNIITILNSSSFRPLNIKKIAV